MARRPHRTDGRSSAGRCRPPLLLARANGASFAALLLLLARPDRILEGKQLGFLLAGERVCGSARLGGRKAKKERSKFGGIGLADALLARAAQPIIIARDLRAADGALGRGGAVDVQT